MKAHSNTRKVLSIFAAALIPALAHAEQAAPATDQGSKYNPVLIGMVTLMVLLLFAVLLLGSVLRQLAFVYQDKKLKQRNEKSAGIKAVLILLALSISSDTFAQAVTAPASQASAAIAGMSSGDFYLIVSVLAFEFLVVLVMSLQIRKLVSLIGDKPEAAVDTPKVAKISIWDKFHQAVAIEREQDIMLDHDYDGIKELDNSLPPWWKYGFYLTIITAIIYLWYYHAGGNGPSSYDEYVTEVQKGEQEKAAYLAQSANNVDENTVTMVDAAGIDAGKSIFQSTCSACHAKDGGGGVGPNLTDEYWLHGGGLKDVFKSIKYGWADKGMKSWKDDFSPKQIAQLASYVRSLKGTKPLTPKDKQGELYNEQGASKTDTAKTVAIN